MRTDKIINFIKTVFVSASYSSAIFIATGLPHTAMALTCNDVVPGTTIKYADALVGFVYDGSKTYAISKSAITGSLDLPEAFFAFSSGIDRSYQYNGVDTVSLKLRTNEGKFGAARPLTIESKAKQDFILKQYLQYLGSAGSTKSTYINAWKEFGLGQPFTDFAGGVLPYTHWLGDVTPNTSAITTPQAVTMGSDGIWLNGENAVRISQIVEFNGKLDCALDLTEASTVTPPTPPPPLPTDPNAIEGLICTQDLDKDGQISSSELQNCIKTPQGDFCPVGSLDCIATFQEAVCPPGSQLNTSRDMCQSDPTVNCGIGYTWDTGIDKCVALPPCLDGGLYNSTSDRCEKLVNNQCPPGGYVFDAAKDVCAMPVDCGPGATFVASRDRCEALPKWDCNKTGYDYNQVSAKCEAVPYCPSGTSYSVISDRCEADLGQCAPGYTYNSVLDKCVVSPTCSGGGKLNQTTNKCEVTSGISCPGSGFAYNSATGKCEQDPSCLAPGWYDKNHNLCLAPVITTICDAGYTWSATHNTCIAAPSCVGGTYNPLNDRCEVSQTLFCADSTYTYKSGTGRCEKSPSCVGGAYSGTYDLCMQPIIQECIDGYSYVPASNRCEYQPPTCPVDFKFNAATNKCEKVADCPVGAIIDASTNQCKSPSPLQCLRMDGDWCVVSDITSSLLCYEGGTLCQNKDITPYAVASYVNWISNGNSEVINFNIPKFTGDWELSWGAPDDAGARVYKDSTIYYSYSSGSGLALTTKTGSNSNQSLNGLVAGDDRDGNPKLIIKIKAAVYSAPICDIGAVPVGGICQTNPTCVGGNFDGNADICWTNFTSGCLPGKTYDPATGFCISSADCSNGLLDSGGDVCFQNVSPTCPSGYSISGSICVANASCASTGVLNGSIDLCTANANTFNCPANYTYSTTYGQCYQSADCGAGGLNGTTDKCEAAFSLTCPSGGYNLNGAVCEMAPPCVSGGSYNSTLKLCDAGSNVCASPAIFDPASDKCYLAASCGGGALNTTSDKCEATATLNCSGWTWDMGVGSCFSSPVCDLGVYSGANNECQATITRDCGTYSWDLPSTKCIQPVSCPQDSTYSLNSSIKLDGVLDICVSDTEHNCVSGTAYNGIPILKCEAVPVCSGAIKYDTTTHSCYMGDNTCPIGSQYSCMDNGGKMQCSENSCFDQSNPVGGEVVTTMDESMYQDDARNPDGSCNGQIMIFAGKPSRCRPPGLKVGYINNCCESDEVMSEDVGNKAQMAVSAIKTMYEIGQVAYYSYMVSTGAYTATAAGGVTTVAVAGTTTTVATMSGAVGSGVAAAGGAAGAAGATTAGTMMASMQAYATALLNPATIAIAIVIMVVMKVLMGSGCDATDIQTGGQVESKQCHYLGDYCEKEWPLFGCVQKAKGYCCFNSMMARIIHEQGRPQLTTFGTDGAWGNPSAPNCRGFVPGEFESLDFAKIDMSEYFDVLQKDMATKIQNAQDQINNTILQRTQQIQSGI